MSFSSDMMDLDGTWLERKKFLDEIAANKVCGWSRAPSSWFFKKTQCLFFSYGFFWRCEHQKYVFSLQKVVFTESQEVLQQLYEHTAPCCVREGVCHCFSLSVVLIRTEMQSGCFQMFLKNCPSISVKISRKNYIYMQYFQWQYFF